MPRISMNTYFYDYKFPFYTVELHNSLVRGKTEDTGGVYVITFRRLKSHGGVLVYSSIYYPSDFTRSLIGYLVFKSDFTSTNAYRD